MTPIIEVQSDVSVLVQRAAELVIAHINQTLSQAERFTMVLAGGSTPKPLYEYLATQDLPWSQIHVFWGDERYVPITHPDSNAGMAARAWLDRVPMPPENIHAMPTGAADPARDAQTYEQELQAFFQLAPGAVPTFDLILLGIGDDGHTASLFPGTEALGVCDRNITVGNKDGQPRLTFTIPVLNQAQKIIFLVAGANKQTALRHIFADQADPNTWPARYVKPQGQLIWLLDQAAGAALTTIDS